MSLVFPILLKLNPDIQGSLVTFLEVGGKASQQTSEGHPDSSLVNSPKLLFSVLPISVLVIHQD